MHRLAFRPAAVRAISRHTLSGASRRFASTTSPVDKPRSWKSSALRWGLAGGALYYYSTSSVFAEEPAHLTSPAPSHFSDEDLPTVDSILESKRAQIQQHLESKNVVREPTSIPSTPATDSASPSSPQTSEAAAPIADGSPAALEEEAGQQGAFNPETGEINWDCPCLGGMAHGPCGEEFKTAFSCFVFSEVEPKGMDCIDKFQAMQDCFRQHPDVYGAELAEDEEAEAAAEQHASEQAEAPSSDSPAPTAPVTRDASAPTSPIIEEDHQQLRDTAPAAPAVSSHNDAQDSKPVVESDPIPAKWDDATAANDAVEKVETPQEKQDDEEKKKEKA